MVDAILQQILSLINISDCHLDICLHVISTEMMSDIVLFIEQCKQCIELDLPMNLDIPNKIQVVMQTLCRQQRRNVCGQRNKIRTMTVMY